MSLEQRMRSVPPPRRADQVERVPTPAILEMSNGDEIRGLLHLPPGGRILDLLNLQFQDFIAVTELQVSRSGSSSKCQFMALNKSFIVNVREIEDPDVDNIPNQ